MNTKSALLGQIITTATQAIIEIDDNLARIIGRNRLDVVGRHVLSFTHEQDRERNQSLLDQLSASGPAYAITKRYVRGDGEVIWVRNHVSAMPDGTGGRLFCATVEEVDRPLGPAPLERNHRAARQWCNSFAMGKAAFGSEMFCAPPGEALLLLYTAELEATALTVEELAERIDITTSVMLRWVKLMRDRELLELESGEPLGPSSVLRINRDCEFTLDGLLSRWAV